MKKTIQKPIEPEPTKFFNTNTICIIAALLIFSICILSVGLYQNSVIGNETRIIKVKYASMGSVVDNCGHPENYDRHFDMTNIKVNQSETYEITLTSHSIGDHAVTNIKRVSEEKYIENC
jgi:hypothetical protein